MSFITSQGVVGFSNKQAIAAPNDVVPDSYFLATGAPAIVDVTVGPKGVNLNNRGAIQTQIPDNTAAGGNKRGSSAVDWQSDRTAAANVASGVASVIGGGTDNKASGAQSTVAGGNQNQATGSQSAVTGGFFNVASGINSRAGGRQATTRGINGMDAFASDIINVIGDCQAGTLVVRRQTADATPSGLSSSNGPPGAANINVMPDNSIYTFHAYVNGIKNGTGDYAGFKIEGSIVRGVGAASVALVAAPIVTALGASAGAAAWAATAIADVVNGGLVIQVTGQAATNIKWCGSVFTNENVN